MGKRILLVDEAPYARALVAQALSTRRYRVDEAGAGRDALERALDTSPNLIILEAMLPFMTGFEVRAQLRTLPRTRRIPILLTGFFPRRPHPEDQSGHDWFLAKPYGLLQILEKVEEIIGPADESRMLPAVPFDTLPV